MQQLAERRISKRVLLSSHAIAQSRWEKHLEMCLRPGQVHYNITHVTGQPAAGMLVATCSPSLRPRCPDSGHLLFGTNTVAGFWASCSVSLS